LEPESKASQPHVVVGQKMRFITTYVASFTHEVMMDCLSELRKDPQQDAVDLAKKMIAKRGW